ncbi:MAG: tRNA uridine-5-carboxymethylaminomethyl(34) synthesis GTPase MnmE [Clostridia bacterium]|nr:tRNA uridine-5-carboxymethylaminomethyl(34) synthesis GTPase MnmE [Clostridia bacterium]
MTQPTNTIAAISTPPGKGGVALIRVSGSDALAVAKRVFLPASKKYIDTFPPRTQIYGYITDDGERVDDVLLTYFPTPHSYTGEDTVEICCHGGIIVTRTVLETVLRAGARYAEAGEFTRRAFLNGRLSLTEAEAIASLLEAQSREQIRLASHTARGSLEREIGAIRSSLVELMSSMYARIDYPDEDLGDFDDAELRERITGIKRRADALLATYKTGRAVAEGIPAVICGKPNVGKSSLYNLLVGEDAAIVTDIEGTTRDVLMRSVPLGRVILNLADTAGIRGESSDAVERIGIEKSREMMHKCELLFAIFDISREFDSEDASLLNEISRLDCAKIALLNKCDAARKLDEKALSGFDRVIRISTKSDPLECVKQLADAVNEMFTDEKINIGTDPIISSARQYAALSRACDHLLEAERGISSGLAQDAVSSDVERALGAISELDGRAVSEEITADIFSKFCVGK